MEFLEGRIFTDTRMLQVSPQDRREWYIPHLIQQITNSHISSQLALCRPRSRSTWQRRPYQSRPLNIRSLNRLLPSSNQVPHPRVRCTSPRYRR